MVKVREICVVTGALVLFAVAGIVVLSPSESPSAPGPIGPTPARPETPSDPGSAVPPPTASADPRPLSNADPGPLAVRPLDHNRTSGAIAGRISLAADVAHRLSSVTIQVTEALAQIPGSTHQTVPFSKMYPVAVVPQAGTPTFWIDDIPFSPHGYLVRVFAPNCNGTERVVRIDATHPEERDVHLSVLAGVPFTVLVRDQLRNTLPDVPVAMLPIGDPPGRPLHRGKTDSFGSVVFENVLQGQYKLLAGWEQQPLTQPKVVQVMANSSGTEQLLVPRGQTVRIMIYVPGGRGLQDADIRVQATDSVVYREYKAKTLYGGECVLQHVPPGQYQLDAEAPGYGRRTRMFKVTEDAAPPTIELQLAPN